MDIKINTVDALYYLIGGNVDYFAFLVAAFTTFFFINRVVDSGMNCFIMRATFLPSVVRGDKLLESQQTK